MGLAASQGRLLLLTARKSDLEYRAQTISQRRLALAQELETVASTFARKSGNRQMKVALPSSAVQGETNARREVNLTYQNLMKLGESSGGDSIYRIVNAKGYVCVPEAPSGATHVQGNIWVVKGEEMEYMRSETVEEDGNTITQQVLDTRSLGDVYYCVDENMNDKSSTSNPLQEGLRNGQYFIQTFVNDVDGAINDPHWETTSWSGMEIVTDSYYTEDDADAQAEYDVATARVQAQDKKLETDQKQIETQHKAVETEVESVNKVIQSNIEGSFKMFS